MTPELKSQLQALAKKYEVASFVDADPSQFLHWYFEVPPSFQGTPTSRQSTPSNRWGATSSRQLPLRPGATLADVECASFIAAMLAFGNRKQFIPKIQQLLQTADSSSGTITAWLLAGAPNFPHGQQKFYRFYSYNDMHCLFKELAQILRQSPTLDDFFKKIYEGGESLPLAPNVPFSATPSSGVPSLTTCNSPSHMAAPLEATPQRPALDQIISAAFPESAIVPKGKNSANKRIHMFLRWMVRQNSPVDLGIWSWYPQAELLIPLDVHVMEEGINLGLLPANAKASRKTAVQLSAQLAEAFPGDPARGDFALFGLGVDENA